MLDMGSPGRAVARTRGRTFADAGHVRGPDRSIGRLKRTPRPEVRSRQSTWVNIARCPGNWFVGPSCSAVMMSFAASNEAAFRRAVRDAIRKSAMTKGEQAVTWPLQTSGSTTSRRGRCIRVARSSLWLRDVSIKTVTRTLAKLREAGCLIAVSHPKGGRTSTRYRLRLFCLMVFCGAKLPTWVEGELAPLPTANVPLSGTGMARFTGDKMSHGLSDVAKRSSGTSKMQVATSLRVVGGRHA